MERLTKWFNTIIKKRRELRRWQRAVMVLAAIMTFATTYALILPAITVEKNNTGEVAGMYLEKSADQDGLQEENALEPAGVNVVADMANETDTENGDVETDAEIPNYEEAQELDEASGQAAADDDEITSALSVKTLKYYGSDYTVNLSYDESSGIPEGANLTVSEIARDSKEYQTYFEEAKKAMGLAEGEEFPSFAARFFDIKIMVDEQEFTPETGVSVEITYAEPLAEHPDTEVSAVHFADETDETEVIEANTTEVKDDGTATVEFTAETFSVYGVIYTVDFHWEVDGKTYDFSIPGGGFVSFYNLIAALGIEADDTGTEKDEIQELMDGIKSITFSNEELLSISKVEENTTVGAIKERLQLECEYSAELTEEQISEINAQEVGAGDWALINLKAFDTEESLTVTMKNGDVWTVKVTDAQKAYKDAAELVDGNYLIYTVSGGQNIFLLNTGNGRRSTDPPTNNTINNYRWYLYRNGNGTFTIVSPDGTKFINLFGTKDSVQGVSQVANGNWAAVTLTTNGSNGIQLHIGNTYLGCNGAGNNQGFYPSSNGSNLIFYGLDPAPGSSEVDGITLTPEQIQALKDWADSLRDRKALQNINKTAEQYDYNNRIYKIDITGESAIRDFYKNVDLGFSLDVSLSMLFPSSLAALQNNSGDVSVAINGNRLNELVRSREFREKYNQEGCFYIISDPAVTSTIYRVFYKGDITEYNYNSLNSSNWIAIDASDWGKYQAGTLASSKILTIPANGGYMFKEPYVKNYTVYYADDTKMRSYYLNQSMINTIESLKRVIQPGSNNDSTATVRVAYNLFAGVSSNNTDRNAVRLSSDFTNLKDTSAGTYTIAPAGNEASGTRQDLALFDSAHNTSDRLSVNEFNWNRNNDRYVVLITDGAPNGASMNQVRTAAQNLKNEDNVKIITVGLSTQQVDGGSRMLYEIADDINGVRQFYEAETANELEGILLNILQQIMVKAIVKGTVSDTIDDAFYPVDSNGNRITTGVYNTSGVKISNNISSYVTNGQPVNAHKNDSFYTWEQVGENWKITWYNQPMGWNDGLSESGTPWTGTFYVKAKEDYLGGNLINTNENATIQPTGFKMIINHQTETQWHDITDADPDQLPVPRVNVHNLETDEHSTTWTVYKGTSVTPKEQLEALWNAIPIEEVVSATIDRNHKITAGREANIGTGSIGDGETFTLASLIEEIDDPDDPFSIDDLIDELSSSKSSAYTEFDYNVYGHESGKIRITVARTVGNETVTQHPANNTTDRPAEQYTVTFTYTPYTETERHSILTNLSGSNPHRLDQEDYETYGYHNGPRGRGAEEDGTITSANTHTINAVKKAIEITKVDGNLNPITGSGNVAQFTFYRAAKNGETIATDSRLPEGNYTEVITISTNPETGKAKWDPIAAIKNADNTGWMENSVYYILETQPPGNYTAYNKNIPMQLTISETTESVLKSADGTTDILYNLTQTPTVTVTGDTPAVYITDISETDNVITFKIRNDITADITIIKTDNASTPKNIGGAVFKLTKDGVLQKDLTVVEVGDGATIVPVDPETGYFTVPEVGVIIKGLAANAANKSYVLTEVSPPRGYIITIQPVEFTVDGTGAVADKPNSMNGGGKVTFVNKEYKIKNEPGAALPATGGPGTALLYILGIMLTCLAGAGLLMRKRRALQ